MRWMKSWAFLSLLSAVGAVILVVLACSLPTWKAVALLLVGVVVFLFVLARNPAHRYWRFASFVTGAWFASHAIPDLTIRFLWGRGRFGELLMQGGPGSWFDVGCFLLIALALLLDFSLGGEHGVMRGLFSRFTFRAQRQIAGTGPANQSTVGDVSGSNNQISINQQHGYSAEEISRLLLTAGDRPPDVNAVIEGAADLLNRGKPDAAEKILSDLKGRFWDRLTPRERYRVVANLGRVKEALGRIPEAADCYLQARAQQPEDNDARALGAVAQFMLGKVEEAHRLADSIVREKPASSLAAAVWIRSTPESTPFTEIVEAVPEEVRLAADVSGALAQRALRSRLPEEAEGYARMALDAVPENPAAREVLGTAIVYREASTMVPRHGPGRGAVPARIHEAEGLLSDALGVARSPGDLARIRLARGQLYDLVGRDSEAETDFRVARENDPAEHTIARQFASFLLRRGQPDRAIDVLRDVSKRNVDVQSSLILASLLGDRGGPEDRREAAGVLQHAMGRAGESSAEVRSELVGLLAYNLAELGDEGAIEELFAGLVQGSVTPAVVLATRADANRTLGHLDLANEQAGEAVLALQEDSGPHERRMVADVLTRLHRFSEALPHWKAIVAPGELSPQARSALDCAWESEDFAYFLSHCEEVRALGIWDVRCVERELNLLRRFHEHDRAIAVADGFIRHAADPAIVRAMRVHLALIGIAAHRPELVSGDPGDYPPPETSRPQVGLAVSQILKKGPNPGESVRYAYELLRRNFSSPEAHYAFIQAVGLGEESDVQVAPIETVGPGAAVKYRELGSDAEAWCIIEDAPSPEMARQEYAPHHAFARAMTGKRAGDRFTLREDLLQKREAEITGIANKYAFRKWDCIHRWEERFPDQPFARMYRLERGPDGALDPSLIFRAVDRNIEEGRSARELYRDYPISVLGFAQLSGVTVAESLRHLIGQEDLPVRCCFGTQEEFGAGLGAIRDAGALVIDPSSVATLFLTGFYRKLPPLEIPTITSTGTLQEYRILLGKLAHGGEFLTRHRGRHVLVSRDAGDQGRFRSGLEEFIGWLESHARIEGGAELAKLSREVREDAIGEFGQPAAECLALAIREGAVLWTDDIHLAGYSAAKHGIRRTWTQAVAIYLQAAGRLEKGELDTLSLSLVEAGFAFTRLPPDVILLAARRSDWEDSRDPFRAVARWLGSDQHTGLASVGVVADVLPLIWREAPLLQQRQSATLGLLRALSRRPGGVQLARNLLGRLAPAFGVDPVNEERCRDYLLGVLNGEGPDRTVLSA